MACYHRQSLGNRLANQVIYLHILCIADRKDEIGFVRWIVTIIDSILNQDNEHKQVQLGTTKKSD